MTTALEGGEWSAAYPGHTLSPGMTWYPFYRMLGGLQSLCELFGEINYVCLLGLKPILSSA